MDKTIFDNAFETAKSAFEAAYKKTGEIVSVEKLRFNLTTLKSKRSKLYASLGEEYYNRVCGKDDIPEAEKEFVDGISELNLKIEETANEINYAKSKRFCPKCGAGIDEKSVYCNFCGAKVTFDSKDQDEDV